MTEQTKRPAIVDLAVEELTDNLGNNRSKILQVWSEDLRTALAEIERLRSPAPAEDGEGLREALEPSRETKVAYSGEFKFTIPEIDEDGQEHTRAVIVPWTTIKEIMAAILAHALASGRDGMQHE